MPRLFSTFSYCPNSFGQKFLDFPPSAAPDFSGPCHLTRASNCPLKPGTLDALHAVSLCTKVHMIIFKNIIITLSTRHNELVHKRTKLAVGLIVPPGKVSLWRLLPTTQAHKAIPKKQQTKKHRQTYESSTKRCFHNDQDWLYSKSIMNLEFSAQINFDGGIFCIFVLASPRQLNVASQASQSSDLSAHLQPLAFSPTSTQVYKSQDVF